ncbi:hypothetical protein PV08_00973 [Exophiala spinifera]|uniref:Uncharacterized protein n=1 Tax=Exophiala spinifera TaxID=91928 RepID=A0A0D2BN81_9EURO|nr:uncharacterized protein PV08_00973 [Exophiala spinifera]KIW20398.1 hypothetical protein PV08_00973 [Exophiala spinifera]
MPFPSLRRRTVNESPKTSSEQKTSPSPNRGRSSTLPRLSPRRSITAMFDSAKRGRTARQVHNHLVGHLRSPTRSESDAIEGDLYPKYDASNPGHDPQRAIDASSVEQPKQFRRPPSPHPLKFSGLSLMSKANQAISDQKQSELSSSDKSSPPKTFLGAITSLFYKENKEAAKPQVEGTGVEAPSSTGRKSPKKSVRFRPENTVVDTEKRSAPIDIPTQPPLLPPIDLTRTPMLTAMRRLQDTIPTGRPQPSNVLRNSAVFRHARETTKASDILPNMSSKLPVEPFPLPTQAVPIVPPETVKPLDDPFRDSPEEIDPEIRRAMREQYGDRYYRRLSSISSSLEIASGQAVFGTGSKAQMFEGTADHGTVHILENKEDTSAGVSATAPGSKFNTPHPDPTGQSLWAAQQYDTESELNPPDIFMDSDSSSTSSGEVLTMTIPKKTRPLTQAATITSGSLAERQIVASDNHVITKDPKHCMDTAALAHQQSSNSDAPMVSLTNQKQKQGAANDRKFDYQNHLQTSYPTPMSPSQTRAVGADLQTPCVLPPALIPLPMSPSQIELSPYTDQYGWCPFHEELFVHAVKRMIEPGTIDFRELVCKEGGLRFFWDQHQLPPNTAPRKDTKGLSLWETDDLLDAVQGEPSVQQSSTASKLGVSVNAMSPTHLHHTALQHLHGEAETDGDFDNSSVLGLRGSFSDTEVEPRSWLAGQVKGWTNTEASDTFSGLSMEGNISTESVHSASIQPKTIELPLRLKREVTENLNTSEEDREISENESGSESPTDMLKRTAASHMEKVSAHGHKWSPRRHNDEGGSDETGGTTFSSAQSESGDEDEDYCRGII